MGEYMDQQNKDLIRTDVPDRANTQIFRPMYCWFDPENGEYSDFMPSRMQVGMCHDFNPDDPHIIEVDIREATCKEDAQFLGVVDETGFIWHLYKHESQVSLCMGPGKKMIPVNITDMRTLQHKRLCCPTEMNVKEASEFVRLFTSHHPDISARAGRYKDLLLAEGVEDALLIEGSVKL
jgi:hypothetical protein